VKAKRKSRRPALVKRRRSRGDMKFGVSGRRSRRRGDVAPSDLHLRVSKVAPMYMPASETEGHEDEDTGIRVDVSGSWKMPARHDDKQELAHRIIETLLRDREFLTHMRKYSRQGVTAKNVDDWDIWDGGAWLLLRRW
jgi:hypothetical protein